MTDTRAQRAAVLSAAAKAKPEAKTSAAEQAIPALVKRGEPINFQAQIDRLKREHRQEVQALQAALEQAHGENLDLRRELTRHGDR